MKILMLTCNASLLDGINRHILTIAPALQRLGVEVAVCTTHPAGEINAQLEERGVQTFSLHAPHGHALPILWRFYRVMRTYAPDLVHVHVCSFFVRVVLWCCFRSIPCVATIHGIGDNACRSEVPPSRKSWLSVFMTLPLAYTIYISDGVRRFFGGGDNTCVGYNPLPFIDESELVVSCNETMKVPKGVAIVGTACRFSDQKNPLAFVRVMCEIVQRHPTAHAVLLGDGASEMREAMILEVKIRNCSRRVHFLGYRQDAPDLIRSFSCFVMTSHWEGLPTALLEAMAAKTPIAFMEGEGGLIDLAELNRTEGPIGVVAPKGDEAALADGILRLLDHPEEARAMAERAFEVGMRHFSVESVVAKLMSVYREVLDA